MSSALRWCFDESLGLGKWRFLIDDFVVAEILKHLLIERNGVAFEGEEHDIRLDERMNVGQLAEELARFALADRLEAIEAQVCSRSKMSFSDCVIMATRSSIAG